MSSTPVNYDGDASSGSAAPNKSTSSTAITKEEESVILNLIALSKKEEDRKTGDEPTTSALSTKTPEPFFHQKIETKVVPRVGSTDSRLDGDPRHTDDQNLPVDPVSAPRIVSNDSTADKDPHPTDDRNHAFTPQESITTSQGYLANFDATKVGSSSAQQSSPPTPSREITREGSPASKDAADFGHILADPEGHLRKTENLFAQLPPVDDSSCKDIVVQPNDVLCGRGGETNHHPGNVKYRSLVKAYQKSYLHAKRRDKPKIAQCIVVTVRQVNGRFLKRMKNKDGGSTWIDVGNNKAREKTSQALREGAPDLRGNSSPPMSLKSAVDMLGGGKDNASMSSASSMGTPLHQMMGWTSAQKGYESEIDEDKLTANHFTARAAQLLQHPIFLDLPKAQRELAILHELKEAKAAAAKDRTAALISKSPETMTSKTITGQGRISPKSATTSVKQEDQMQYKHLPPPVPSASGHVTTIAAATGHPGHGYPYYEHSKSIPYYSNPPSVNLLHEYTQPFVKKSKNHGDIEKKMVYRSNDTKSSVGPQSVVGKEPAVSDNFSSLHDFKKISFKSNSLNDTKSSGGPQSVIAKKSVVSNNLSSLDDFTKISLKRKMEPHTSEGKKRGGSRLKLLKRRMKDDFDS